MVDALSEYRLKTIKDRQRFEARKLRIANERVAELEAEVAALRTPDDAMPDTSRVPTESDSVLAGMLSTIWPMSTRHPQDSIHLAIFVNDLSEVIVPLPELGDEEPLPDPCAGFGCVHSDINGLVWTEHTKDCPRFAEFEYAGGVEYLDGQPLVDEDSDPDDDEEG